MDAGNFIVPEGQERLSESRWANPRDTGCHVFGETEAFSQKNDFWLCRPPWCGIPDPQDLTRQPQGLLG